MEFSVWGLGFGLDFVWFWGVIGGYVDIGKENGSY